MNARAALEEKLKEAYLEIDLRNLDKAIEIFKNSFNRPPADVNELVAAKIVTSLPPDPFGGTYYIDEASGKVATTSINKGISDFIRHGAK